MLRKNLSKIFVGLIVFPFVWNTAVFADGTAVRNDGFAVKTMPTNLQSVGPISSDQYGRIGISDGTNGLSVVPVSNATSLNGIANGPIQWLDTGSLTATGGTTTVITTASTSTLRVGDIVLGRTGTAANLNVWAPVTAIVANTSLTIGNALPSAPANADTFEFFRPVPMVSSTGVGGTFRVSPYVQIDQNYQSSTTLGLLKLEDAASASGDALVATGSVVSGATPSALAAAGDYTTNLVGTYGNQYSTLMLDPNLSTAFAVIVPEDSAIPAGAPIMMIGAQREDALTANTGASADATNLKTDSSGRLITTKAPPAEMWTSRSSAITTATTGTLKASVASNFIYLSSFTCTNTGGTATLIDIEDGSGTVYAYCNLAATTGQCAVSFPDIPARLPVASALNVKAFTAGGSVLCAAAGSISTQ